MARITLFLTSLFILFMSVLMWPVMAMAQEAGNPADSDFFNQVLGYIGQFGGLSWMAKIAGICLLIIAATKTSFLSKYWQALPNIVQTLGAPLLALLGGFLSMGSQLSFAAAFAYAFAGGGAVIMHELLDGLKTIPGIGSIYVTIINIVESMLGGQDKEA